MIKTSKLKEKEVVNVNNGKKLGGIVDVDVDLGVGKIKGILVPKENTTFSFFSSDDNIYIPWSDIYRIGEDVILVKLNEVNNLPEE